MRKVTAKNPPPPVPETRRFEQGALKARDRIKVKGEAGAYRIHYFEDKPHGVEVHCWGGPSGSPAWHVFMLERVSRKLPPEDGD